MVDLGKQNLLGVRIDAVDYEASTKRIIAAAAAARPLSATALAVHGVMTGALDTEQRFRINNLDMVTPDGQPVRWGLNLLHRTGLKDRVYGPALMLRVCAAAAQGDLPIYLYGSSAETLELLSDALQARFPGLQVADAEPSKFRQLDRAEWSEMIERIRGSGAKITFVGLGCPRQETYVYECAEELGMPVIAVGAAFDYHSGVADEPGPLVQRLGLQWAHRLAKDPRRLWRRYLGLNGLYLILLALQLLRLWRPVARGASPRRKLRHG